MHRTITFQMHYNIFIRSTQLHRLLSTHRNYTCRMYQFFIKVKECYVLKFWWKCVALLLMFAQQTFLKMRSILSPRSVSGVGASRHPLGCLSCKGSMDPKTKIFAQNPRLCIQDRHVNGPPEKRPKLCMQDRHLNGPFGENRAFLCIFCTFPKWVFSMARILHTRQTP